MDGGKDKVVLKVSGKVKGGGKARGPKVGTMESVYGFESLWSTGEDDVNQSTCWANTETIDVTLNFLGKQLRGDGLPVTPVLTFLSQLLVQEDNRPNVPKCSVAVVEDSSSPLNLLLKAIKIKVESLFVFPINDAMGYSRSTDPPPGSHWSFAILSPKQGKFALLAKNPSPRMNLVFERLVRGVQVWTMEESISSLYAAPASAAPADTWSGAFSGATLAGDMCRYLLGYTPHTTHTHHTHTQIYTHHTHHTQTHEHTTHT
jgi:hypothetical protein